MACACSEFCPSGTGITGLNRTSATASISVASVTVFQCTEVRGKSNKTTPSLPSQLSPADLAYTLPLVLHEDAGPYGKSTSVAILNYSSILGRGAELECKLVSAAFTKGDNAKPLPTGRGWAMFLESIGHVLRGVAPLGPFEIDTVDYRMAGSPIMKLGEENWNGLMLFGKADSEHQVLSWGAPSYNSNNICRKCPANRSDYPYTDGSKNSRWRRKIFSLVEQLARMSQPPHPLCNAVFYTKEFIRTETMHVMDCNGTISHHLGSILYILVHEAGHVAGKACEYH